MSPHAFKVPTWSSDSSTASKSSSSSTVNTEPSTAPSDPALSLNSRVNSDDLGHKNKPRSSQQKLKKHPRIYLPWLMVKEKVRNLSTTRKEEEARSKEWKKWGLQEDSETKMLKEAEVGVSRFKL